MTRPANILIAEDDCFVCDVVSEFLSECGDVTCAGTPPEALHHLGRRHFDLVVLDCLLPQGGSGPVLAAAEQRNVPVLLISGAPEAIERLSQGRYPSLLKPFGSARLMEAVTRLLRTRHESPGMHMQEIQAVGG